MLFSHLLRGVWGTALLDFWASCLVYSWFWILWITRKLLYSHVSLMGIRAELFLLLLTCVMDIHECVCEWEGSLWMETDSLETVTMRVLRVVLGCRRACDECSSPWNNGYERFASEFLLGRRRWSQLLDTGTESSCSQVTVSSGAWRIINQDWIIKWCCILHTQRAWRLSIWVLYYVLPDIKSL